tara:strand:+ start:2996 stop:3715 length:720 start_codon:yes stop_codon:yes gene_type:complete
MLNRIKIVLVGTTHSGNIGSSARAMKTMGLSELVLVNPQASIDGKAMALAAGAGDILQQAQQVDTLQEAIADCALVVATSARQRGLDWPTLNPREAGQKLVSTSQEQAVAIVFGRESSGLSNEELQFSDYHVVIDANPQYSSLNLSQAVQLLSYEVRMAYLEHQKEPLPEPLPYPLHEDLEKFYTHLESSLLSSGFIVKNHPGQIMSKLRRLFQRARPEVAELNILRGILSSIDKLSRK